MSFGKQGTLSDHVDLYCDHRDTCGDKKCRHLPMRKMKAKGDDIAFVENCRCHKYRGEDELGAVKGANIREVGVWK